MHNAPTVSEVKNVDETQLVEGIDGESLREEVETCRDLPVDSEMENSRHWVFNFAMETSDAHILSQKLDTVFEELKCAAKITVAFGFVLKNVENGTCRYHYAHKNNIFKELSKVVLTENFREKSSCVE